MCAKPLERVSRVIRKVVGRTAPQLVQKAGGGAKIRQLPEYKRLELSLEIAKKAGRKEAVRALTVALMSKRKEHISEINNFILGRNHDPKSSYKILEYVTKNGIQDLFSETLSVWQRSKKDYKTILTLDEIKRRAVSYLFDNCSHDIYYVHDFDQQVFDNTVFNRVTK